MASGTQKVGGIHTIGALLGADPNQVVRLWADRSRQDPRLAAVLEQAAQQAVEIDYQAREALDQLLPSVRHQGLVAEVRLPKPWDEARLKDHLLALEHPPLLLVLDGVTDPHNLGACLRSADGAGVDAVIAPRDRAASLTATACKVASGAAGVVPFAQVTNLSRTLRWLQGQGIWLVGASDQAEGTLYDADLNGPLALVLGAEGKGLRRLTAELCDLLISIPMRGGVSSLNVSVATGVCLYEALRQRQVA